MSGNNLNLHSISKNVNVNVNPYQIEIRRHKNKNEGFLFKYKTKTSLNDENSKNCEKIIKIISNIKFTNYVTKEITFNIIFDALLMSDNKRYIETYKKNDETYAKRIYITPNIYLIKENNNVTIRILNKKIYELSDCEKGVYYYFNTFLTK